VALVDDGDYDLVMRYRWNAIEQPGQGCAYALTNDPAGPSRSLHMHTLITGWAQVDHRDHNGLNNQRANLRPATHSQNLGNQRKRRGTASRYKGVTPCKRSWQARIRVNGKQTHLGTYGTEEEAARAYDAAARRAFGEFACLNFPVGSEASALEPRPASRPSSTQVPDSAGTSRYRGVFWSGQKCKWQAKIHADGKQRHLGFYVSETEAALAYDDAARDAYGAGAWLNFPDGVAPGVREQLRLEREAAWADFLAARGQAAAAGVRNWWAQREPAECICEVCGAEYLSRFMGQSKYCSRKCNGKARRARDRQRQSR